MALTYVESATLMNDPTFRGRVKVACLQFATYIAAEDPATSGHNSRYRWAQQTFQQPDMVAMQIQPPTVMDAAVQAEGEAIDDAGLQSAVENVVNKIL